LPLFTNTLELDFSHLGAWQTALLKDSMVLLRLFEGRCARATRKKSPYVPEVPTVYDEL
jgi:hypothetical protein